jgi:hypothetical protein
MKIKILLTAILLMAATIAVQAQTNTFDKLSDHEDISTVFISKSLLKMMPDAANVGGTDIKGLANKLEQMEIYNSKSAAANKLIRTEVDALVKSKTYETLMSIKDKKENMNFYVHKDKGQIKDLIMYVNNPDECTIIRIQGSFTPEDIQSVMNSKK